MFDWWTVKGCVMRSHFHLHVSNVGVHLKPAVSIWPFQNSLTMKVRSPKVPPSSSGGSLLSVPAPAPTQRSATCTFSSHSRLAPPANHFSTLPLVVCVCICAAFRRLRRSIHCNDPEILLKAFASWWICFLFYWYLHHIYKPLSRFLTEPQWWHSEIIQILVRISRRKRGKASLEQTGCHGISYPQPHADEWTEMLEYKPLVRACREPSCASKLAPFWLV